MNFINIIWQRYKATTPAGWRIAGTIFERLGAIVSGILLHEHPELSSLIALVIGQTVSFCFNLATIKEGGKVDVKKVDN